MSLTSILAFLSGLGFGTLVTTFVKHRLDQKSKMSDLWLKEYKEACDGLLDAYRAASAGEDGAAKAFARWEARLQLLASPDVIDSVRELKESEPNSPARSAAHIKMIEGMRRDLGIATTTKKPQRP